MHKRDVYLKSNPMLAGKREAADYAKKSSCERIDITIFYWICIGYYLGHNMHIERKLLSAPGKGKEAIRTYMRVKGVSVLKGRIEHILHKRSN